MCLRMRETTPRAPPPSIDCDLSTWSLRENNDICVNNMLFYVFVKSERHDKGCGWESLMKNVTLGNVTMSHRTRERPAECLASLSHSTMIGLPRAQH
ncbi:hypothetical protein EVAR_11699_1 [Eumeta japonica]|uniref:Uncharacterized protein n=1 Tax=Eumeta variegata TaxID=151549 RepID=A0A4C1U5P9_EUMVA|nr:hypothetical protein EVAR_11699_1 [Eumeta japonica]